MKLESISRKSSGESTDGAIVQKVNICIRVLVGVIGTACASRELYGAQAMIRKEKASCVRRERSKGVEGLQEPRQKLALSLPWPTESLLPPSSGRRRYRFSRREQDLKPSSIKFLRQTSS